MKKYLLVSLTILFAASFVWAADAAPATSAVDVEADSTLSWGVDLGTGDKIDPMHGFKNEASFGVKFPLIKKGDKTSAKSDTPVYGQISLKNIELKLLSEKNDKAFHLAGQVKDIEAKLVFYGAYLMVYDAPDFRTNYAQIWKPLVNDKKYQAGDYRIRPGVTGMGTKLGYANKDFMDLDVGLKLGSNGPWDTDNDDPTWQWKYFDGKTKVGKGERIYGLAHDDNYYPPEGNYLVAVPGTTGREKWHSKYAIGVDFSIKPLDKILELALTVNSTFSEAYKKDHDGGVNFGVEVKSEPIDGLKLKAGFDGGMKFASGSKFEWDTIVTAEYKWISGGVYLYSPDMTNNVRGIDPYFLSGFSAKDGKDITDVAFFLQFATTADKKDAANLVEGLDAGVHLAIYQMGSFLNKGDYFKMQFPLLLKVWGSYQFNLNDSSWLKPFASVWGETNHGVLKAEQVFPLPAPKNLVNHDPSFALAYSVGLTYSPVEKVEVTAEWNHGILHKNKYRSAIKTPAGFGKNGYHNGEFVLSLTLTY